MKKKKFIIILLITITVIVVGYQYRHGVVLPPWLERVLGKTAEAGIDQHAQTPSLHIHEGEVVLSAPALKNIGITDAKIGRAKLGEFKITTGYPGMIVTRPGRTEIEISAPVAGTIVRIYYEPGQELPPNAPLFDIDLTNEDFVDTQTELLMLYQKSAIIEAELERLKPLATDIVPKTYRDTQFQKLELDTSITLQRKKLILYGLSDEIIDSELKDNRRIIKLMTVHVPEITDERIVPRMVISQNGNSELENGNSAKTLQIISLNVEKGMRVSSGNTLAKIADYSHLFIRGNAFDYDEAIISGTVKRSCAVTAVFDGHSGKEFVSDLCLRYVESRIDPQTLTLAFYVDLQNNRTDAGNTGFIDWKFKPGQRCELRMETDAIENCIVLPRTAIASEGAETSVFAYVRDEQEMKVWLKTPVHVIQQNQDFVAVANDGSLKLGRRVALEGASQLLVALNTSSGNSQIDAACAGHDHGPGGHSH